MYNWADVNSTTTHITFIESLLGVDFNKDIALRSISMNSLIVSFFSIVMRIVIFVLLLLPHQHCSTQQLALSLPTAFVL